MGDADNVAHLLSTGHYTIGDQSESELLDTRGWAVVERIHDYDQTRVVAMVEHELCLSAR
jgi:hypothetical protein